MPYVDTSSGVAVVDYRDRKTGKFLSEQNLIVGSSGIGKGLMMEYLVYLYWMNGYTIISLTDVKNEFEFAEAMFKPKEPYHVNALRKWGCRMQPMDIKIYHPFTLNIPSYKLPEINFFTFNIKNIGRSELNFIGENETDKTSFKIITNVIENMKKNHGLHHLLYEIQKNIESDKTQYKGRRLHSLEADEFFVMGSQGGTEKNVGEIVGYFKPFLKNYMLGSADCPLNLDFKKIVNDQKHYHILTTKWIKDEKMKSFVILFFYNQIVKALEDKDVKYPVCFVIDELGYLCPQKTEGYTVFLSNEFRKRYKTIRSMGHGCASVSTTQVYYDIHEDARSSATCVYIGNVGSNFSDVERMAKALKWRADQVSAIKNLPRGQFICTELIDEDGEKSFTPIVNFLPPHRHKEERYRFLEDFEEEYPDRMKDYNLEINQMEALKERIENDVKKIVERDNELIKKQIDDEVKRKDIREKLKNVQDFEKVHEIETKAKDVLDKREQEIYEYYLQEKLKTPDRKLFSEVARHFGILIKSGSHVGDPNFTQVKRIIKRFEKMESTETEDENETEEKDMQEL